MSKSQHFLLIWRFSLFSLNLQCKSFFARYKTTRARLRREADAGDAVINPDTVMQAADDTAFDQEDEDAALEAMQVERFEENVDQAL